MQTPIDALADDFYEAAMLPEFWPVVLQTLSTSVSSVGATIIIAGGSSAGRWVSSESIRGMVEEWIAGQWHLRSQRGARLVGLRKPGFVPDHEAFTPDEMDADPGYAEFLRPRGLGWAAGTFVGMPMGDAAIVSIERRLDRGPFTSEDIVRLEALRPHIARSVLMAARLGLERAHAAVAALDAVGLPAALVRGNGGLVAANPLLESLDGEVIAIRYGKVHLSSATADGIFGQAIRQIALGRPGACSVPVRPLGNGAAHIAHVIPVRKAARDIFTGTAAMIVMTPVTAPSAPHVGLLEGLFDLTPAEARVASGLAGGETIAELSRRLGTSEDTARTHLKSVFAKTGTRRQADLVALLSGLAPRTSQGSN